jgi:hypothetical protein
MSKARFDRSDAARGKISRCIKLLSDAQSITDDLRLPHLGARIQEVIDELSPDLTNP